jgi:hypothetical protein
MLTEQDKYGFSTVRGFGKYEFKGINWEEDKEKYPNSLIVGAPEDIPNDIEVTNTIVGSNEYEYFRAASSLIFQ